MQTCLRQHSQRHGWASERTGHSRQRKDKRKCLKKRARFVSSSSVFVRASPCLLKRHSPYGRVRRLIHQRLPDTFRFFTQTTLRPWDVTLRTPPCFTRAYTTGFSVPLLSPVSYVTKSWFYWPCTRDGLCGHLWNCASWANARHTARAVRFHS